MANIMIDGTPIGANYTNQGASRNPPTTPSLRVGTTGDWYRLVTTVRTGTFKVNNEGTNLYPCAACQGACSATCSASCAIGCGYGCSGACVGGCGAECESGCRPSDTCGGTAK